MSWFWVRSHLGWRAKPDLSPLPGVAWGTTATSVGGGRRVEVQMAASPVPLSGSCSLHGVAASGSSRWAASGAGKPGFLQPWGPLQFITSECLEHLMCQRSRNAMNIQ